MARTWARFDDLRTGKALLCPPPSRILTAVRPDEVAGVLQQVPDATEAGSWARQLEAGRLHERVLTAHDLRHAERVAVLNSLRGWRAARLVGGERPVGGRLGLAVGQSPAGVS